MDMKEKFHRRWAEEVPLEHQDRATHDTKVSEPEASVRGIYLHRNDFEKHGWTPGCAKCRFMVMHPHCEGGPVHSNMCKSRLKTALQGTAGGNMRVEQAEKRLGEHIVRGIERMEAKTDGGDEARGESNSREERLDQSIGEDARMRHDDEVEPDAKQDDAGDEDATLYDMFVGATDEGGTINDVAAEVNVVNREIVHLAMRMGVDPRAYGSQLRDEMTKIIAWEHGEDGEDNASFEVECEGGTPGGSVSYGGAAHDGREQARNRTGDEGTIDCGRDLLSAESHCIAAGRGSIPRSCHGLHHE